MQNQSLVFVDDGSGGGGGGGNRINIFRCLHSSGITTISEQGTYDELKSSGGTFQQWHEFKTNR